MQLTSARALPLGTVIAGEWRVERMLGEGGFAVTYEAHSPKTGQQVALKEYMPAGCCNRAPGSSQITASAGKEGEVFYWGRERFMKEAETLARLDHPSIVRVAGYFEANGTAYMALAYEAGGTLKSWLARLGRAPTQAELDAILWPLLDALKEVHSLFLLHRDIKPDNILMRGDGTPVLIDFGATRSAIVGHTQAVGGVNPAATSAFAIVSHGYSPPEQYDPAGRMVGPVSDVYALAATLYTSLTGGPPPAATSRHFNDPYQPLAGTQTLAGYRAEFLAGIDRALALNPKDRPQSAVEFRRAIGLQSAPQGTSLTWRPTEVAPAPGGNLGSSPSVPRVTFTTIESGAKRPNEKPRSRVGFIVAGLLAFSALVAGGWWETKRRIEVANATRLKVEAEAKHLRDEQAARDARVRDEKLREQKRLSEEQARRREEAARKKLAEDDAKRKAAEGERLRAEELIKAGPMGDLVLGRADAPVTIVEYASMTCGHCAAFHKSVLPKLKEKYIDTGKVRFILREFPLDNLAAAASMLVRCIGGERSHTLINELFAKQDSWAFVKGNPVPALFQIAQSQGFTREAFDKCLTDQVLLENITATRDRARKSFSVDATPAFFINGRLMEGRTDVIEAFDKAIERASGPAVPAESK